MSMEVYRIDISSWTSSFRYPNLISGFQPTLEVPPISTVLGLINAAAGQYLDHSEISIGYYFKFELKAIDLESIYQIESKDKKPTNSAKSNIIKREFLYNNFLSIYLKEERLANYFYNPNYQLVLGRSNDLATVEKINKVKMKEIKNASNIKGQIVPLNQGFLPGQIQALPKYFSNTVPRRNIGTEPYSIVGYHTSKVQTKLSCYKDEELLMNEIDIYFHNLKF